MSSGARDSRFAVCSLAAILCGLGLALLLACAETRDPAGLERRVHPEEWLDSQSAVFHGDQAIGRSVNNCADCHGEDYHGGELSGVSCYQCHNGPGGHPVGYLGSHGDEVASRSDTSCRLCHGDQLQGGFLAPACTACHAYPFGTEGLFHPAGWFDAQSAVFHGNQALDSSVVNCAGCHGEDYHGGEISGVGCYQCHNGPGGHPEGYLRTHGDTVATRQSDDRCRLCHGDQLQGGFLAPACTVCHIYPFASGWRVHPAGWLDLQSAVFHGDQALGSSVGGCTGCHGTDYRGGGFSSVSCYQCHDGPSGHPADYDRSHGDEVERQGDTSCRLCHGDQLQGGFLARSCTTCHSYPGDD